MSERLAGNVAIVDYGMGNLFSVKNACEHVELNATITSDWREVVSADAVIVPGVGSFGNAMDSLNRLDLVEPLRDVAVSGKPLIGICLGLQLFMTESFEFGFHKGLDIIEGQVMRLGERPAISGPDQIPPRLKVPHVGWNRIFKQQSSPTPAPNATLDDAWANTPLSSLEDGEFMYFVHSFYGVTTNERIILSSTRYGDIDFCSSLLSGNIFACQFHPERSGPRGLIIYRNLASLIQNQIHGGAYV